MFQTNDTLTIAIMVTGAIALLSGFVLFSKRQKNSKTLEIIRQRVDKVIGQAMVVIPQSADYPGSLGKEGAQLISELNSNMNLIKSAVEQIDEFGLNSENMEYLQSFDFQQALTKCEKNLKLVSKKLVDASKVASAINLPRANKNKSTIQSLEEVGLIDKEEVFDKL
ncbi:MAG TPA: LPXTG cell wall anchor domain-containing protein [Oligoflexia bacterium]|nr:LPXTG cell wall anchor domain-containing protein [Oligoflexia bacterium]HMP47190.1 LPXTG cell wall anchor domain-containing protein [Oligoflexia bacterium]